MSGQLPLGHVTELPIVPGRWSLWSEADEGPGSKFFVPADDIARASGLKYAVARISYPGKNPRPQITLLRTHPPVELPNQASERTTP